MVAAGASDASAAEVPAAGLPSSAAGLPSSTAASGSSGGPSEYRLQFAWPPSGRRGRAGGAARMEAVVHSAMASNMPAAGKASGVVQSAAQAAPRKSLSMGALRQQRSRATEQDRTDGHDAGESEPLMAAQDHGDAEELGGEEKIREEAIGKEEKPRHRKEFKTEYKKKFRPFSQYEYVEGRFLKKKEEEAVEPPPAPQPAQPAQAPANWYTEVIELRKKAGEYKHRGWGTELVPEHISELYSKQMLVWEQVSRRSSLSALSLAAVSTPRSISKEEKEKENSRRTSPTKPRTRPHTAQPKLPGVHEHKPRKNEKTDDNKKEGPPRSSRKEFPLRHHLERTTGAEDGAVILSPTREKLEPVAPRRREDGSAAASPKRSPKRLAQTGRSQSLGPAGAPSGASETRSPKKTPRAPSAASKPQPPQQERRPRPTTLNTTAPSRSKSRTSAPSKGEQQAPVNKSQPSAGRAAASGRGDDHKAVPGPSLGPRARARPASGEQEAEREEEDPEPEPDPEPEVDLEPIVKSPPEPTRVKSPEQIIMKSPEPVNWTVPLDTGKTFTVTQNVPDAERPHATPSPAPSASGAKTAETSAPKPAPRRPDPSAAVGSAGGSPARAADTKSTKPEPPPASTATSTTKTTAPTATASAGVAKKESAPTAPTAPPKSDPMTTSIMGGLSESGKSDPVTSSTIGSSYSGSSIPKSDTTTHSGSSLKSDPMATSMTASSIAGSSLKSDPMAMSMTASSLGGSSLKSDPMATSMTGSSLGGSSLKSDPMATSMMGSSLGSSFDPMSSSMMGSSVGSSSKDPMSASMMSSSIGSAKDPMTTSMIGSLGGSSRTDPMTTSMVGSGRGTINGLDAGDSSKGSGTAGQTSSTLSGTTLRCLEDPSFSFDSSKNVTPAPRASGAPQAQPAAAPGGAGSSAGYRVLEAPASQAAPQPAEVHDSARDRFDKFWGKDKDEKL